MTILALPAAFKIRAASWGLRSNTQTFTSPLNRNAQTQELAGAVWACELEAPPMTRAGGAAACSAFLARLRGQAGRFYLPPPPPLDTPRGTALGSPVVAGGGQSGGTLLTEGWTAGATLLAGDYLSFDTIYGRELKMVVEDAAAAGSPADAMAIAIEPPIRTAPADNAAITVSSPSGIFRLVDDDQARWSIEEAQMFGFSFAAVESFYGNV